MVAHRTTPSCGGLGGALRPEADKRGSSPWHWFVSLPLVVASQSAATVVDPPRPKGPIPSLCSAPIRSSPTLPRNGRPPCRWCVKSPRASKSQRAPQPEEESTRGIDLEAAAPLPHELDHDALSESRTVHVNTADVAALTRACVLEPCSDFCPIFGSIFIFVFMCAISYKTR